jgi:hypothetical protein
MGSSPRRSIAISCNIAIDASAPAIRLNSSSASTAEPDRRRSRPLRRRSVRVGEPGRPSATYALGTSWGTTRRVGSVPLATFAEAPRDTADTRSSDLTECVRSVHQDDARIARPGRFPYGARRECAPTPNAGFCSLGTMRKLAAPKTSLRSAAVMATLRTADLSCADWRRASTSRWDTKRAPPEYRVVLLANCATSGSGWQTPAFTLPRGVRDASAFSRACCTKDLWRGANPAKAT